MQCIAPETGQQQTDQGEAELRAAYGARWDILHTTDAWHAIRRDPSPSVQGLSAHTAAGLWRDLACIEEAAK